ncbi:MAG: hypothetical protein WDW38_005010 [Sanguina aurantia]
MDPRTGAKITKLRGHTGNVRCLLVHPDGKTLLSGSSDSTVKLWDVGMQRCVQTYSMHSDSVWALQSPTSDLSVVLSGGRDGCVYRTHIASRTSELLLEEKSPVSCLAYDPPSASLFVGRHASSSINRWKIPQDFPTPTSSDRTGLSRLSFSARPRSLYNSSGHSHRAAEAARPHEAVVTAPCATIVGHPGIVDHRVMSDRRTVLTKNMDGNVHLWDVHMGAPTHNFGKVDLDAKEAQLFDAHAQHSWFTLDHRLGQLCITMEPTGCFMAEDYAQVLGYLATADDHKLNFGQLLLDGAFSQWRQMICQNLQSATDSTGSSARVPAPQQTPTAPAAAGSSQNSSGNTNSHTAAPDGEGEGNGGGGGGGEPTAKNADEDVGSQSTGHHGAPTPRPQPPEAPAPELEPAWTTYFTGVQPAVISSTSGGMRWSKLVSAFSGTETEPEEIPGWVGMWSCEGQTSLPRRPNAPSFSYQRSRPPSSAGGPSLPELEITCNGWEVPHDLSLAAVRKYIWKKGNEDLVFLFKIRDPANPAPLPTITLNS